ncbi:heavy-metal-associated domain-containing protein [Amycolatopsis anabasis]|uniref:heavy-metal-associated domain-containing protein n=1 Tax=Amycolatopsis anabasis TaxID=1840409 RepID=UPI00131E6897|nr:heavy metal-associated domain-containing protein [Amycolatopsis anabasis]
MTTSTFEVQGMTCAHCVGAVKEEVARVDGVTEVGVDLPAGQVTVTSAGPVDPGAVRAAVEEAGYQVVG